jgi:hypothetical protein
MIEERLLSERRSSFPKPTHNCSKFLLEMTTISYSHPPTYYLTYLEEESKCSQIIRSEAELGFLL